MAQLHSNGPYEPSALQYLIDEDILPEDPDPSRYEWSQQISLDDQNLAVIEEILRVDRYVTWSRNGVVRRVFNLDIEDDTISHAFVTTFSVSNDILSEVKDGAKPEQPRSSFEPALVVLLKTHAHIFCLSGGVYIIPLPCRVTNAIPCQRGFLLQTYPSFQPKYSDIDGAKTSMHTTRASFLTKDGQTVFNKETTIPKHLPTYCVTELLSEIGVVAVSYSRNPLDKDSLPLLPSDEELIYVSTDYDMYTKHNDKLENTALAVSLNRSTSSLTVWQVRIYTFSTDSMSKHSRSSDQAKYRRRQSSNVHERARITSGRPLIETSRESLGGLIQSFVENQSKPQEPQLSKIESLAAELGHDFEPSGIQTRSARRISSMLARTDLAPSKERSAFNENLLGVGSRKSLSRTLRQEGSFGSFTDRISFGGRKSLPVNGSVVSNTTSFNDLGNRLSARDSFVNLTNTDPDFGDTNIRLQRDVVFAKLKTIPCDESTSNADKSNIKVIIVPHPHDHGNSQASDFQVSVCVQESQAEIMTVVTIAVKAVTQRSSTSVWPEMKAVKVQKGSSITSACVVNDGQLQRLLILSKTSHGDDVLHFEAPWSPSFRADLPDHYLAHNPRHHSSTIGASRRSDGTKNRTLNSTDVHIARFLSPSNLDRVSFTDKNGTIHDLSVVLAPGNALVRRILDICKFVLPVQFQDSLLVAYWESSRWLRSQNVIEDIEWTAMTVTLFALAVPFISSLQNKQSGPHRKSKSFNVGANSSGLVEKTAWPFMSAAENMRSSSSWMQSPTWAWIHGESTALLPPMTPTKRERRTSLDTSQSTRTPFVPQCIELTKDFLQSPAGESINGTEGYLPTAMNQDRSTRRTSLASIVVALHLLFNELRVEKLTNESLENDKSKLGNILKQLSSWLDWTSWKTSSELLCNDFSMECHHSSFDQGKIDTLDIPPEPFTPRSIFEFIDSSLHSRLFKYHSLAELIHDPNELTHTHPSIVTAAKLLPRISTIISLFNCDSSQIRAAYSSRNSDFGLQKLMPEAIAAACLHAVMRTPSQPNQVKSSSCGVHNTIPLHKHEKHILHSSAHSPSQHIATRDIHMIVNQALDAESLSRWDVSSETDRQTVTKLIFHQDRRFQEASKLLNQTRAPEIEYDMAPHWTEADALEAQKMLAQYATRRTFSVATGRGMMHFNARMPLLTEMVPMPRFSLQCVMRERKESESSQAMTFSADRALFTEDKVCWAFFHNGASVGLMVSKDADFIDTSWILYNKPADLTNRHAGFLLGLGLNGHLKSLAKWVAFKYLTPKHTMTSVGLLLGLAASYRGTADTRVTRLLSVHTTCLLPPGAAELNLSSLTQTAGIVGIGLLYHDSQHRRMSEVMLSEIENLDAEDRINDEPILRDEGYRLAAGISLGLINLGQGLRLHSLHDMRVVERLIAVAVGTKNVNLVHVLDRATAGAVLATAFIFLKTNDASVSRKIDVPDTMHQFDYVRPDIFLLRTLARHLIMWDKIQPTRAFIQGSLPKTYRHRADLGDIKRLITNDLPLLHIIAGICFAIALRFAGSQCHEARDLLVGYLDHLLRLSRTQALTYDARVTLNGVRNCLDTLALSCAMVMAGSGDLVVFRRLRALHGRTDKDTPFGSHLAAHMAIGALFLSGGTATFGTSGLAIASLIIAFYPLFPTDVLDNRGHLQALRHLWVLAVEPRCLTVRDGCSGHILGNIVATLHLTDGRTSQQRTPGIIPDFDNVRRITIITEDFWPLEIDLDQNIPITSVSNNNNNNKPQTLREYYRSQSAGISLVLHRRALYDKPELDPFDAEIQALDEVKGISGLATASTLAATSSPGQHNPISTQGPASHRNQNPLSWVFDRQAFKHLEHAERALILSGSYQALPSRTQATETEAGNEGLTPNQNHGYGADLLAGTPIDTALEMELGTLGPDSSDKQPYFPVEMQRVFRGDKLWQLRILLSWADRVEHEEDQNGQRTGERSTRKEDSDERRWISRQVVERLRWRVWKMTEGDGDGGNADG